MKMRIGRRKPRDQHRQLLTSAQRAVRDHAEAFFGVSATDRPPRDRWVRDRMPGFVCFSFPPGERTGLWSYISAGCWDAVHRAEHGLEFVLLAPSDSEEHVLHLTAAAYYHCAPEESHRLDHAHTVPIGEPWMGASDADHLLVSLPYPLGPDFERCEWDGGHARILWLLPITAAERDFKAQKGIEELERLFDANAIKFWEPDRPSVI